ncbi:MAG: GNVR domain-containing protein [Thermodesulfobacteriota bacterium]|nr:GNVR domain-containing protein [Thermodesulfobacteriota bacterium]
MTMDEQKEIDLKGLVRRRKKIFLISFLGILVPAVFIAFVLPPIYLSQSTILIEDQQIPREYVQTTITGYVEERLQIITQQIMSRSRLTEIMDRFNLYADMRQRHTTAEILAKMRGDINLQTISADVMDKRTGRPTVATIAFTLSYEGKSPATVQKVANVLTSFYLEQNLKTREEMASTTTSFLQQELDGLKGEIDGIELKISDFKRAHLEELPERNNLNMQTISQLHRDLDHIEMQLNSLQERKILLQGQLANVDPLSAAMTEDGKAVMHPGDRLKYLRLQLVTLQSTLSEKHPDVIKVKREIGQLESQVGESDDVAAKIKRLEALKAELDALSAEFGPKHPDVVKLSKEAEALGQEVEALESDRVTQELAAQEPDNPAYINLKTQLDSMGLQSKSLLEEREQIRKEIARYQQRIENAPLVEKEYNNLIRNYENAQFKYKELMNKLMEAKLAQGMEETQRGERFTIIEPAQLPEKPYKPNRMAIMLIGLVLALGAGVGLAAVRESLDTSVKTAEELGRITGVPVLSVISLMESEQEVRSRRVKKALLFLGAIVAIVVALVVIHQFVMPLEVVWAKIQRRVTKMGLM